MGRCAGITAAGDRCKAEAMPEEEWCWNHHPDYEQARRRRASKGGKRGGRGRPQRETEDIKTLLEDLTDKVLSGDLETGRAAVANQLVNTRLRAIEQERKIRETQELEARIEALEAKLPKVQPMKGARR
jgi:hypothetical protein